MQQIEIEGKKSTEEIVDKLISGVYQELKHASSSESTTVEKRLESFVYYLIKNQCKDDIVRLALFEQFSLPSLANESTKAAAIQHFCELKLKELRKSNLTWSQLLKSWHQAYHCFRVSANCFVLGTEAFVEKKYDEALDLFMACYIFNQRNNEEGPTVSDEVNVYSNITPIALL